MFSKWILMLTAIACLGALLDPMIPGGFKNAKSVLALIIALSILSPLFSLTKTNIELPDFDASSYEIINDYDSYLASQITGTIKDKIYAQTREIFIEVTGCKPYAMDVKTEMDESNTLTVKQIKIVHDNDLSEKQKETIQTQITECFAPQKIQFVKVN